MAIVECMIRQEEATNEYQDKKNKKIKAIFLKNDKETKNKKIQVQIQDNKDQRKTEEWLNK